MALNEEQREKLRQKFNIQPEGGGGQTFAQRRLKELKVEQKPITAPVEAPIEEPKKQGILGRIGGQLKERGQAIKGIFGKTFRGEINPLETAVQTIGQAAGGVTDIAGEAIVGAAKAVTPDIIEKKVGELGSSFLNTKLGQVGLSAAKQGFDKYQEFKKSNPDAAANIEGVVNIASLFPVGRGGKVVKEVVKKTTRKPLLRLGGEAIEEVGKKGIVREKESFIRRLIRPEQTKKVKESQVARTTETGKGIFKRSEIVPTKAELNAEKAISGIAGVTEKNTVQGNFNVIQKTVKQKAIQLEKTVGKPENNVLIPKIETKAKLRAAAEKLKESPTITGDAEKTATKLLNKMNQFIDEQPGTAQGVFKARKKYDNWVKTQKPNAFDAKTENAFSIANREIRDTLNNLVEAKATNVAFKKSLVEQRGLFNAMDNLIPKAATEADSAIGRALQTASRVLGTKNKIVQGIAALVGIGGLGAAAGFAPAAAGVLASLFLLKGGKLILSPKVRVGLGKLLIDIDKKLPTIKGLVKRNQLLEAKGTIQAILNDFED